MRRGLIGLVVAFAIVAVFALLGETPISVELVEPPASIHASKHGDSEAGTITVYAAGPGLTRPGRYRLPADGEVADLVRAAGGLKPGAFRNGVPWRRPLEPGLRLYVPTRSLAEAFQLDGRTTENLPPKKASQTTNGPAVNINRASTEALQQLPDIGPVLAERILRHRRRNGPFATPDDLRAISGIGAATVRRLRPFVTVR